MTQQNLIDAARAIGTKPVTGRYFLCLCSKCGWLGSSEETRLVEDPLFGDGEYFCAVCGAREPDEVDAAEAFNAMLAATASRHPDDVAVDRFALAMKAKLADARAKGRGGWDDPAQCSVEFLAQLLVGHIGKDNAGNFEDVANLAMMLHQRGADPSVLAEAARDVPAGEPVTEECQKAIRRVYVSLNSPIVAGRIYAKYNRKVIEAALEVLVQVHDQLASKEPKHD